MWTRKWHHFFQLKQVSCVQKLCGIQPLPAHLGDVRRGVLGDLQHIAAVVLDGAARKWLLSRVPDAVVELRHSFQHYAEVARNELPTDNWEKKPFLLLVTMKLVSIILSFKKNFLLREKWNFFEQKLFEQNMFRWKCEKDEKTDDRKGKEV